MSKQQTTLTGTIGVRGQRLRCWVGTEPHEKIHPQELLLDIEVQYAMQEALLSDQIENGVNYVELVATATQVAQKQHTHLIERLAAQIIDELLQQFPKISSVRVRIEKPQAIATASCAFAQLEGHR